ncbi:MAG: TetR/AcrR family transcriptional regulator [Steroidobacteraceae bacterium]
MAAATTKHSLFARATRKDKPARKRAAATTAGTQADIRERRRAAMFNAAIECIEEYGLGRTTMEDVAARSGFSRISVYREFRNRETLIRSVIVYRAEIFNAQLAKRLGKFSSIPDALEHYLMASIKFAFDDHVTGAMVRGPIDFAHAGSPHHDIVMQTWAPLFATAKAQNKLPASFSAEDAVSWILITQFTMTRLVVDARLPAERLRELVRSFVLPAFGSPTEA